MFGQDVTLTDGGFPYLPVRRRSYKRRPYQAQGLVQTLLTGPPEQWLRQSGRFLICLAAIGNNGAAVAGPSYLMQLRQTV